MTELYKSLSLLLRQNLLIKTGHTALSCLVYEPWYIFTPTIDGESPREMMELSGTMSFRVPLLLVFLAFVQVILAGSPHSSG